MAITYGRPDSEMQLLDKYPRAVRTIDDIPKIHHEVKEKLKNDNGGFFGGIRRWYHKRQADLFELNKDDFLHAGASGELQALYRLSRLGDSYHVLCGVSIELDRWVTYNGKKNLKSAQMDFVVVSKKGVAVIEVKNWGSRSSWQPKGISPHEQVDRAGRVLWIALQSWWSPKKPRVSSIVLSIQGNIAYNPRYKHVRVADLKTIGSLLENRKEEFTEKEVGRIVARLKHHVTR